MVLLAVIEPYPHLRELLERSKKCCHGENGKFNSRFGLALENFVVRFTHPGGQPWPLAFLYYCPVSHSPLTFQSEFSIDWDSPEPRECD